MTTSASNFFGIPTTNHTLGFAGNIFDKTELAKDFCSITFYPKAGITWEQIDAWFKNTYPQHNWVWRGFGEIGTPDYVVVLIKNVCRLKSYSKCVGPIDYSSNDQTKWLCCLGKKGL
jgi:hypothetical protein